MNSTRTAFRDRLAHRIANFALNRIATKAYRDRIDLLMRLGINEWVKPR